LDARDVAVAHSHANRGEINEQPVDAAVQVAANFSLEVAMRRRRGADPQILRKKFILARKVQT
jgi:hypothetical protein